MTALINRRALPATALALLALMGWATLFAGQAAAANQSVSISGFAFNPATVTVNVGDTVTWTNNDAGIPHTASSDTPGVFDSGSLNTGGTFAHTFTSAGSFPYHCNIHPGMNGLVVVQGQAASPTATNTTAATATSTTATATATPTAATTATATTAAATATPTTAAASATSAASPTGGTTAAGTPAGTSTSAPQPPATGDSDGDGGSNALLIGAGVAVLVLAVGGVGYGVMRRRA